jgi:hypothetical protein
MIKYKDKLQLNLNRWGQIIKDKCNRWWGYRVIYKRFDLKTKNDLIQCHLSLDGWLRDILSFSLGIRKQTKNLRA